MPRQTKRDDWTFTTKNLNKAAQKFVRTSLKRTLDRELRKGAAPGQPQQIFIKGHVKSPGFIKGPGRRPKKRLRRAG